MQKADGGVTYYYYASNNLDLISTLGPRNGSIGQVTYYGYGSNDTGLCTKIINAISGSAYFTYDSKGNLKWNVNPLGKSTYYFYDSYGDNTLVLDTQCNPSYFGYNANKRLIRSQDQLGFSTYYYYNSMDELISKQLPTGEISSLGRTNRGLVKQQAGPGGRATYYSYDVFPNLLSEARVSHNALSVIYYTYDNQDNLTSETDPNGNLTRHVYDLRNLKTRSVDAVNNTSYFVYDPAGNVSQFIDARGNSTRYGYDSLNRVASVTRGVQSLNFPDMTSILAHWRLDESSGARADDSGHGYYLYDGNSNVGSSPGVVGNAANLVSANSCFLVTTKSSGLRLNSDLTAGAWAKCRTGSITNTQTILGKSLPSNQCMLLNIFSNTIYFQISYDGSINYVACSFPLGFDITKWHHYLGSYEVVTGILRLYIDGVMVSQLKGTAGSTPYDLGTSYFCVGGDYYSSLSPATHLFDGLLDEVVIYNKVLSQKSISQLVQQRIQFGFGSDPADLISTYFSYDLDGNVSAKIDGRGSARYFGYDAINRQIVTLFSGCCLFWV